MNTPQKHFSLIFMLAFIGLAGCSKTPGDRSDLTGSPAVPKKTRTDPPFAIQVVETPELLLNRGLRKEARQLFRAKDFEKLEKLAQEYRSSKQTGPCGGWMLVEVYEGIVIRKESTDEEWKSHLTELQEWVRARPQSITARVSLARAWTWYAWKARGGGYADTVSEEQFKLFGERLDNARKVLLEASKLKEHCPVWWSVLLRVALGLGMERREYDALFRQALAEYPSYDGCYYMRAWFLLPRWYGKEGEWEADLKKSADQIGGDDGDVLYAKVVWDMQGFHENVFTENKLSWSRVDKGFEIMEQRFPDSLQPKSASAFLASLGAERSTAKKYLERLEGKVDLVVWESEENFRATVTRIYAE
jgi:hypothetical protein